MPNTEHTTELIKIATSALELKQQHRSYLRRAAIHQLHIKQVGATERDLQRVLAPMFQRQVDSMISKLLKIQNKEVNVLRLKCDPDVTKSITTSKIAARIFNKEEATKELIDVMLPILAVRMIEAANNQLRQLGVKNRRKHVDDLGEKYNPNQPRVPAGGSDGGQFGTGMVGATFKNDRWHLSNGDSVPEHIPKRIPSAWTHVEVAMDPKADLLVKGRDGKGRQQCIYSESHVIRQAAVKFSRITELLEKQRKIEGEIDHDLHSKDAGIRENAAVLRLINSTGIRPGSSSDTHAEKQAYGATTLQGRHVVVQKRGVRLRFVGKKGVDLDIPVTDANVAQDLIARKQLAGNKGRLFDTTADKLRDYTHSKDGGSFKPKDFRTAKGTSTAVNLIAKMKAPKTTADYKRAVRAVAKKVSAVLGNTPAVALQSYINPSVFSSWRIK
jgi:DNA topoisomerase-1